MVSESHIYHVTIRKESVEQRHSFIIKPFADVQKERSTTYRISPFGKYELHYSDFSTERIRPPSTLCRVSNARMTSCRTDLTRRQMTSVD
ncbi:hypothetical protein CEXT_287131 [Caerostris extrusa]|uniref:Uncharacterized protein n=1 Tax=Caerostris extrusa TaxID=172846 RepID=A0AAV4VD54_CAEEX|nr:hypothetical protein CEXT_287131 [Caerostris extrusa]